MNRNNRRLKTSVRVTALFAVLAAAGFAFGQTDADRIKKLEDAVGQLQSEAARTNECDRIIPLGKEAMLKVGGFIQANGELGDVSAFEGRLPGGPNEIKDRIRLRRARINLSGDAFDSVDFKMEGDFEQSDGLTSPRTGFSGTDIFMNYHKYPELNFKVGQFKAPFGLEQITPDTVLYTIERSLPTAALTPERQVGAQIWGKPLTNLVKDNPNLLTYAAGVFNGNGRNATVNDNNDFMCVGRIDSMPINMKIEDADVKWRIGIDGFTSKDATNVNVSQVGGLQVTSDGSLAALNVQTAGDERTGYGVNQTLTVGPFDLIAEYLSVKYKHALASIDEFTANGYYVQGSYFLPGRKLQLVAKYDAFDPDQKPNDDINSILGGINWYIKGDDLKLMLDYVHTSSDYRDAHRNLGDSSFDEVLLRLQILL